MAQRSKTAAQRQREYRNRLIERIERLERYRYQGEQLVRAALVASADGKIKLKDFDPDDDISILRALRNALNGQEVFPRF